MACFKGRKDGPGVPEESKEVIKQQMDTIRLLLLGPRGLIYRLNSPFLAVSVVMEPPRAL